MAQKVTIKKKTTTKTRTKKSGNGTMQCNMCHGTGKVKKPKKSR